MASRPISGQITRWERHHTRHEAPIGVRFAGCDKLVHLIGAGEVVPRLGRGFAERLYRAAQAGEGYHRWEPNRLVYAAWLNSQFAPSR